MRKVEQTNGNGAIATNMISPYTPWPNPTDGTWVQPAIGTTTLNWPVKEEPKMIYKKITQVMAEIGAVGKDQKNTAQGYKFRGIDDMINAAHPAFVKAGVFLIPEVLESKVEMREVTRGNGKAGIDKHVQLRVKFTFFAEDGSHVSAITEGEGLDSGDKATNKAMSAALKYALIQSLSIPTADMEDADRVTPTFEAPVAQAPVAASAPATETPVAAAPEAAPRASSFKRAAKAETNVKSTATKSNDGWE